MPDTSIRQPLPTKEQIQAIDDVGFLAALLDDVQATAIKIEVDLEFGSDGDDDWEHRARQALSHHRICASRLEKRINARGVQGVGRHSFDLAASQEKTRRHILSLLEGISFQRCFMVAAKAALPAAEYAKLVEDAHQAHSASIEVALEQGAQAA